MLYEIFHLFIKKSSAQIGETSKNKWESSIQKMGFHLIVIYYRKSGNSYFGQHIFKKFNRKYSFEKIHSNFGSLSSFIVACKLLMISCLNHLKNYSICLFKNPFYRRTDFYKSSEMISDSLKY